MIILKITATIK